MPWILKSIQNKEVYENAETHQIVVERPESNDIWEEHFDENSQRVYYSNIGTSETKWTLQPDIIDQDNLVTVTNNDTSIINNQFFSSPEWIQVVDEASGEPFWYNKKTGVSSWRKEELSAKQQEPDIPPAPNKWTKYLDESSGRFYFYNEQTGDSQWTKPENFHDESESENAWEHIKDKDSGRYFYFNRNTGETQWEKPKDLRQQEVKQEGAEEVLEVWEKLYDSKKDRVFYFNKLTNKSQWENPFEKKIIQPEKLPDEQETQQFVLQDVNPPTQQFVLKEEVPENTQFVLQEGVPKTQEFVIKEDIPQEQQFILRPEEPETQEYVVQEEIKDIPQPVRKREKYPKIIISGYLQKKSKLKRNSFEPLFFVLVKEAEDLFILSYYIDEEHFVNKPDEKISQLILGKNVYSVNLVEQGHPEYSESSENLDFVLVIETRLNKRRMVLRAFAEADRRQWFKILSRYIQRKTPDIKYIEEEKDERRREILQTQINFPSPRIIKAKLSLEDERESVQTRNSVVEEVRMESPRRVRTKKSFEEDSARTSEFNNLLNSVFG
eukprot:maker-scaffold_72-snap-gene-0.53-mRNA-1 protein AED:0.00 eAED:0.00 QI:7/1/1/1/0.5/0.66/3/57/552